MTDAEFKLDIQFLLMRSMKSGSFSTYEGERDVGQSSNSIVAIAYGVLELKNQRLPSDHHDLDSCNRMFEKLPDHRKNMQVIQAITAARENIKEP